MYPWWLPVFCFFVFWGACVLREGVSIVFWGAFGLLVFLFSGACGLLGVLFWFWAVFGLLVVLFWVLGCCVWFGVPWFFVCCFLWGVCGFQGGSVFVFDFLGAFDFVGFCGGVWWLWVPLGWSRWLGGRFLSFSSLVAMTLCDQMKLVM